MAALRRVKAAFVTVGVFGTALFGEAEGCRSDD